MTVKELSEMLAKVMAADPAVAEREVIMEGCDCCGHVVGYSLDKDDLILRREDGTFRGDKEYPVQS